MREAYFQVLKLILISELTSLKEVLKYMGENFILNKKATNLILDALSKNTLFEFDGDGNIVMHFLLR